MHRSMFRMIVLSIVMFLLWSASVAHADPGQTITIKDWTGRGFPPDLVNYDVAIPSGGAKSINVVDAAGNAVPSQVTATTGGRATLSFVTDLPANGQVTFTVRTDGKGDTGKPGTTAQIDGESLVLANAMLGVRVPKPKEMKFATPVPASSLPAPVLAFRGPDGAWRGRGTINHDRPVSAMRVTQTASGPVYHETVYRLEYQSGGYYQATVRVTDRLPFARVSEEFDLGVDKTANTWRLNLSEGWNPDAAEHMFVAGQGSGPVKYPSLADEEKLSVTGPSGVGVDTKGNEAPSVRAIHHDSCWGSRFVSYYGVHNAAARKADPANYPFVIVAPLHKGSWRRANSLPVAIKDNNVTVSFPMDVAPISWLSEPASDVSPFSCHEHDPSLPTTTGRRIWALVLAQPAMTVVGYSEKSTASAGYAVRALYGLVGLDRYKDFILNWPDAKTTYPRVFFTPEKLKEYVQAVKADPNFPLLPKLQKYFWFTNDEKTAKDELQQVRTRLAEIVMYIMTSISIHHHQTLEMFGEPIGHTEAVLGWPGLSDEDRKQLRGYLALLCYLQTEPDVTSAGDGSHHGNPNMGVARLSDRSNPMAMIPDHPMFKVWRDYMSMFTAYKTGSFMAPAGGWFEYGPSYHMHGYGKIIRGMMGLLSTGAPDVEAMVNYQRLDMDYYLNLLSPVDPRFGCRVIPGMANSGSGSATHLLQGMGTLADRDPKFAANMRWGWEQSGKMIATGGDAITIPAMVRPSIAAVEPKLTSRSYPGFGVIFRAHQGDQETALYLRSGYLWSHWSQDQGNIILYSRGSVLLPPQPYQYGGPKDPKFYDKNLMRFGDPGNDLPHAWADSNIIDSAFGSSVDYAWSSTGYPDWYVSPGGLRGFGKDRPVLTGSGQVPGAFTWDRQIVFLKGDTGAAPNYFVVRDSIGGKGRLPSWMFFNLLGRKSSVQVQGQKIAVDTEWPVKLDMVFPDRKELAFDIVEDELATLIGPYNNFGGNVVEGVAPSRDWVGKDGKPAVLGKNISSSFSGVKEQRVSMRLASEPGQGAMWLLYPRAQGEAEPEVKSLAEGVVKVSTLAGTDYVFASTKPIEFKAEGVEFVGLAGAVRVRKDGKATLVLSAGPGTVGYKASVVSSERPFEKVVTGEKLGETLNAPAWSVTTGPATTGQEITKGLSLTQSGTTRKYVVDSPVVIGASHEKASFHARRATVEVGPETIRFVVPERSYVQLSVGNVGVRGVGPFDLTFSKDQITGKVDGDVRTIVTTWPTDIVRPMFHMDGVLWYAGFADEHSIVRGTPTPQFAIAFGVTPGPHEVKIGEWKWPAMPAPPMRAVVTTK